MRKLAGLLCLCLILGLAGCGSQNGTQPTGESQAESTGSRDDPGGPGGPGGPGRPGGPDSPGGPGENQEAGSGDSGMAEQAVLHPTDVDSLKKTIDGEFTVSSSSPGGFTREGSVYTFTKGGVYSLSGVLEDGQLVIDAGEEKVELCLCGVSIGCSSGSPIYGRSASRLSISAEKKTYNVITDSRPLKDDADEAGENGAIYARCDMTITGSGALLVESSYRNGIHCTKDLTVKKLALKVVAAHHALKGNDSVEISSGELTLIAVGGDGIKTEHSDVSAKGKQRGTVTFAGGTVDIYAARDGVDAAYDVTLNHSDVNLNIYTGSYSPYTEAESGNELKERYLILSPSLYREGSRYFACFYQDSEEEGVWAEAVYALNCYSGRTTYYALRLEVPSGYANVRYYVVPKDAAEPAKDYSERSDGGSLNPEKNAFMILSLTDGAIFGDYVTLGTPQRETVSAKGIKAANGVTVLDGRLSIKADDDGIHSNNDVELENGAAGEGFVTLSGGYVQLMSGDDAIHADGVLNQRGATLNVLRSYEGLEANVLNFDGGSSYVYASDDGINATAGKLPTAVNVTGGYLECATPAGDTDAIDSNGGMTVSGGFVLVRGGASTGAVAGSIDVGEHSRLTVTGGTVVAFGGICELPDSKSVCTAVMQRRSFAAGSYTLTDGAGKTLAKFTLPSSYSSCWIASSGMSSGGQYRLETGGGTAVSWTQTERSCTVH